MPELRHLRCEEEYNFVCSTLQTVQGNGLDCEPYNNGFDPASGTKDVA